MRRNSLVVLAAVVAVLPAYSVRVHAQSPVVDSALNRAVAAFAAARTMRATFEQTLVNPLTNTTVTSRGEFTRRQPNQFAFEFSDPKGDRIVSDGHAVWVYLPSTDPRQVIRVTLGRDAPGGVDPLAEFFTAPRDRYNVADGGTDVIDRRPARALVLSPKSDRAPFVRARVWVDPADGSVRQFQVEEPSGVKRLVRITSLAVNVPLRPSLFSFVVPKGVRVVDQTTLAGT